MAINSAQIYVSIEPVTRKDYGLGKDSHKAQFSQIMDTDTTEESVREFYEIGGPGRLDLKTEGQAMQGKTIQTGPVKRVQAATYAASIDITREAVMDSKVKAIKSSARSLGRATSLTPEYLVATFLDRAFNSAYPVTADAKELCSTAHLTPYGVTFSNALATPAALSETSLEDIKTALRGTIGPDGMLKPVMPKKLIVPSALANLAEKLTTSKKTLGSANNDPSVVAGMDFMVFDYLTNATRFFVKTDAENGFYWDWREKPQFERDNVAKTQVATFIAFFRAMWGAEDPRCVYASNAS
jgi:hypothetical protein